MIIFFDFYYIFCSGCNLKLRWKSLQNQKDFFKLQDLCNFIKSNLSGFDICKFKGNGYTSTGELGGYFCN